MTYRPWSSVTTDLAYLVGSTVVSAITHTPASGPFALRTTPPMSSLSMATSAACWAGSRLGAPVSSTAMARAAALKYSGLVVGMVILPWGRVEQGYSEREKCARQGQEGRTTVGLDL